MLHGTAKFKSNLTFKLEHNCDCHTVVLISVSDWHRIYSGIAGWYETVDTHEPWPLISVAQARPAHRTAVHGGVRVASFS